MKYFASVLICLCGVAFGQKTTNQCRPLDVVVLVDGSSSIGSTNFRKEVGFIQELVKNLHVSPDGSHVSMLQVNKNAVDLEFGFSGDETSLLNAINSVPFKSSPSFALGEALKYVETEVIGKTDRSDVPDVILLLCGGRSEGPLDVAERLRGKGIRIIAIDMAGNSSNASKMLLNLAGNKTSNLYRSKGGFPGLTSEFAEKVATSICDDTVVDCVVEYGPFTECDKDCGGGTMTRNGEIKVKPNIHGRPCSSLLDTRPCNTAECSSSDPVDCEMWYDEWSPCSATCGIGSQTRIGMVATNAKNNGSPCPPSIQVRKCNLQDCRIEPELNIDCERRKDGDYAYPINTCSSDFVTCSNGIAYLRHCPNRLYFSEAKQSCNNWAYVEICSGKTQPPRTTTTTTEAPSTEAIHFDCVGKRHGFHTDPMKECSGYFYVCYGGSTSKQRCPVGLFFDIEWKKCDKWQNVYVCSGNRQASTTTAQPLIETTTTEAPPIDCANKPSGEYSDPTKACSHHYYTCDNGRVLRRICPGNTFFDVDHQRCDIRHYIPGCGGVARTTPDPEATTTTKPITTPHPFNCYDRNPGNYPAGDCRAFYWTCVGDQTLKRPCPSHLRYDLEFDRCELRQYIPKCGGVRPTAAPTEAPTTFASLASIDCGMKEDGGIYGDPMNDCATYYYVCTNGELFTFDCPDKLYFNPRRGRCNIRRKIPACRRADKLAKNTEPL